MKTLIAYATRYGATAKTARLIAEELGKAGIEATVIEAKKVRKAELEAGEAFVIGSSIAMGMWKGAAKRLVGKAAKTGKPVAVFVTAGGVIEGRKPGSDPAAPVTTTIEEREAEAIARYARPVAEKAGLEPAALGAFGGRMEMSGKVQFDNWDPERIRIWASSLAAKLK
jgi:menaquinone-dependent protoporphyrinogen IX oxidase